MSSSAAATTTSAKLGTQPWKLEGDYFEGCNCDITCPCTFTEDPDEGECYGIFKKAIMVIPSLTDST
jgi:hypothetical protein